MASALVNNVGPVPAEGFLDLSPSAAAYSYGWFSPRISFSRDFDDDDDDPRVPAVVVAGCLEEPAAAAKSPSSTLAGGNAAAADSDLGSPGRNVAVDFEFRRLDDPVAMLPADELFSDGKLVPRQLAAVRAQPEAAASSLPPPAEIRSPEPQQPRREVEVCAPDPYAAFSPKAPTCTSRWRELLRLKKAAQSGGGARPDSQKSSSKSSSSAATVAVGSSGTEARSRRYLIHRIPKPSPSPPIESSLNVPLLRESDYTESALISSRPSLSSSSASAPDHGDHSRHSLDKPSDASVSPGRNPPRVRLAARPRSTVDPSPRSHSQQVAATARTGRSQTRRAPGDTATIPARSASVDSPRMNSSGKVVFQGLGRSSSSPSTFNGGPRVKHRGMDRSYSATVVQVTPVLNVPVCSLLGASKSGSFFGFGHFFSSPQKKDPAAGSSSSSAPPRSSSGGSKSWKIERA